MAGHYGRRDNLGGGDHSTDLRLARLLRPYSARLAWVVSTLMVLAGVNVVRVAFIGILIDSVFPQQQWGLLGWVLAGILMVYIARNVLFYVSKYTAVRIGENLSFTLRKRLFEQLQQMNLHFFRQHKAGKVSSRVMNDSFVIQSFIQDDLPKFLQALFLFLGLVVTMYVVNWQLALVSTIVLPLHMLALRWYSGPIKAASSVAQEQMAVVQGNLIEKFMGAEVVKGFTGEQRENEAFVRAIDQSRDSQLKSKKYLVAQKVVADLLIGMGTIGLLGFGAYQVMSEPKALSVGMFVTFFGYVGMMYPTVIDLMGGVGKLVRTTASVDRVFEMLESQQFDQERPRQPIRPNIRGEVELKHVTVRYEDGQAVLKDISLKIPAGHVCAVVGPSGAGKSTLARLVSRLLDPIHGKVFVDGVDVRDIELQHLRQSVGIAFQECFLFNSSVYENLRYARPDASRQQIIEIAKRTGADDFITRLPQSYETIVGESGLSLSRGQKQRINLTRAMLKNPQILILDEATVSMDIASERKIIESIFQFMKGKTTILITHRPELLRHADMVVHLVEGRVAYKGLPSEMVHVEMGKLPEVLREMPRRLSETGTWSAIKSVAVAGLIGLSVLCGVVGTGPTAAAAEAEQPVAKAPAKPLTVRDLARRSIRLSYAETTRCEDLLKTLGYNVIKAGQPIDMKKLPTIVSVMSKDKTGLVSDKQETITVSSPVYELIVFYDPSKPEQYARLADDLETTIDIPDRQVVIEAMILDISKFGLEKLGIEWELQSATGNFSEVLLGRLPSFDTRSGEARTTRVVLNDIFNQFQVTVEALVRDGQAQVLARPSVLTINNRQTQIHVGESIPESSSVSGLSSGDKFQIKFDRTDVGITLNVRPRVSADGEEVSLQIHADVKAVVPGEDVVVFGGPDGETELASAPTISIRRVQTRSRVANNTPFIIGGLIAKDAISSVDKVPLLGDIPLLGLLFQTKNDVSEKREVIIVITPYVLPEEDDAGRNLPKDEDAFDSFDNQLFRDAYRIRAEDVFDLAFLKENDQVLLMQQVVDELLESNADLAEIYPYNQFAKGMIPGERVLVYRQMYEVGKRRWNDDDLDALFDMQRIIFFEGDEQAETGFSVQRLWPFMAGQLGIESTKDAPASDVDIFKALKSKAIALTYTLEGNGVTGDSILSQPVPQVALIHCPDDGTWSSKLWQLNQPDENGRQRYTILIHNAGDIERLKRAIILKRTVELVGSDTELTLANFTRGRLLRMPTIKPNKYYLIDDQTAKYFFYTEQYYPALRQELNSALNSMRASLKDPAIRALLADPDRYLAPAE